ncbi:Cytochrome P450-like protein [Orpheovirus IHUMI-LCC2]|uniref:Cytochrome P450-like protein n=1 Tax=Orpheovirus IHUMI-LCC2 TaxID=2023057 RepID=A0A2I2L639_9VIRU|nr:Cytochrome P450-like protein [Orpheovirus IHUMI-LCC2]SNW63015.1 Cytochrome P450-like protein [Orpheovirus IHUMI-LCC2]
MLIYLSLAIFLLIGIKLFNINSGKRITDPPIYPSLTILGPMELFKNPLDFARKARSSLGVDVFTVWMLGKKLTFVFGKENVLKLTDAENTELNFEDAYQTFLKMAFGNGILNKKTAPEQVALLKKYLADDYVEGYLEPSYNLAKKIIGERLGDGGEVDIQEVVLKTSFTIGARNFLGTDFLQTLKDYDYKSIFSGFEMGMQFATEYIPLVGRLKNIYDKYRTPTPFAKAVMQLAKEKEMAKQEGLLTEDHNMFENAVLRRHDQNGPSKGDDDILINLMKIIVFGSGFNGYNMMSYFLRANVGNEELWNKLREEQRMLDEKYGEETINSKKISEMRLLYESLMKEMFKNTFPFLLRSTEHDYQIGDYIVPKGHSVAYSPQIEHDGKEYINDQHFNLIFGKGTHACPARKYAKNSMMIILSLLIKNYNFGLLKSEPMVNTRLITFPTQPSIQVKYEKLQ